MSLPSGSPPPPLICISKDDYSAADPARQRINAKSRRFISLPNLRSPAQTKSPPLSEPPRPTEPATLISLDSTSLDAIDVFTDKYEWAVVYENQRGMTLFSIPYYSRLSLLPSDPPPFTIPNTSVKPKQTNISLDNYPLPDGTWQWVSKCWMIDMRSDTGEVQHDGFEYNWMFRTHKWRAEVGTFSAGGWVRRRRWIRLMMRPRIPHTHGGLSTLSISAGAGWRDPSVESMPSFSVTKPESPNANTNWIENDVDGNWLKCRLLMKYLGRDGRKLELWKIWLAHYKSDNHLQTGASTSKGKGRQIQQLEAATLSNSDKDITVDDNILRRWQPPSKEDFLLILRSHGNELLQTFIYPESRASFLAMLSTAGLLPNLDVELGTGPSASGIDFWSYVDGVTVTRS